MVVSVSFVCLSELQNDMVIVIKKEMEEEDICTHNGRATYIESKKGKERKNVNDRKVHTLTSDWRRKERKHIN